MPRLTCYIALPFYHDQDGNLVAGDAVDLPSAPRARIRASAMVGRAAHIPKAGSKLSGLVTCVGATALSGTSDPAIGHLGELMILARFGETPEDIEGMK